MAKPAQGEESDPDSPASEGQAKEKGRREIPGNLPYLPSHGALKNVLTKVISAAVPEKFSQDYLATILGYSGGSYRQTIPILKRTGFITGDGKPTEIYSRFRTDTGRASAAYLALRAGFSELFKRNEHVYAANDQKLTDLIVEVTGLAKSDPIVSAIRGTFRVLSFYLPPAFSPTEQPIAPAPEEKGKGSANETIDDDLRRDSHSGQLNLAYNINVVLPDTRDIDVFNAIFRSLRDHLLR